MFVWKFRITLPCALIPVLLVLSGCSGSTEGPERYAVSGEATLDGEALVSGSITFESADGTTATDGGSIQDGNYNLQTTAGTKIVRLTAPKVTGERKLYDTPDSPMAQITEETIHPRYNTESTLTITVTPTDRTFDFPLQSDASVSGK
jgi:hypothetical protein